MKTAMGSDEIEGREVNPAIQDAFERGEQFGCRRFLQQKPRRPAPECVGGDIRIFVYRQEDEPRVRQFSDQFLARRRARSIAASRCPPQ